VLAVFGENGFKEARGVGVNAKKEPIERDDLRLLQSAQAATILSISTALATESSLAIGIT
jgi:hypothetical protein